MDTTRISKRRAALIGGTSGLFYWIGLVGIAAGARTWGPQVVGAAWWVGGALLFVVLLGVAARAGLLKSVLQGLLAVALALAATALFAFWALVLMVNVLESLGIPH